MNKSLTPMGWPPAWKDPAALELIKGTPINCLLLESGADLGPVAAKARQDGLTIAADHPPDVQVAQGAWPGIRMGARGGGASAGPTGVPWLDSNGWRVRLESALHPGSAVWIDAPAKGPRMFPESYAMAYDDAAVFGGRWIISLDDAMVAGMAGRQPQSMDGWNKLVAAIRFFDAHKEWGGYMSQAVAGVVSSFAGDSRSLSSETLNLLTRANQQYRVIVAGKTSGEWWKGLRAVLYVDARPPSSDLRQKIEALVENGGLLI